MAVNKFLLTLIEHKTSPLFFLRKLVNIFYDFEFVLHIPLEAVGVALNKVPALVEAVAYKVRFAGYGFLYEVMRFFHLFKYLGLNVLT